MPASSTPPHFAATSARAPHPAGRRGRAWIVGCLYGFVVATAFSIALTNLALALLALGLLAVRPAPPVPWPRLLRELAPFWVLFAVGVLSVLFGPDPAAGLPHVLQFRLLLLPLMLLLALPLVPLRTLLAVLCGAVTFMGLYGVVQLASGTDPLYAYRLPLMTAGTLHRARGGFTHPLSYAGYMLMAAPLFGALATAERTRLRRLWAAGGIAALLGALASLSRSGFVGLAMAALVLLFMWSRRLGWTALVLGVALLAVLATSRTSIVSALGESEALRSSSFAQRYLLLDPMRDSSLRDRILVWEAGLRGFADRPLLGFGVTSHDPYLAPYQRQVVAEHGMPDYVFTIGYGAALHNMYVRVLFEQGLLGMAAYLGLWAAVLWAIVRALRAPQSPRPWHRALLWGLAAALAGSMASALFEDNFFDAEVQVLIITLMTLALYVARVRPDAAADPARNA